MSSRRLPTNKQEMLSAIKDGREELDLFLKAQPLDASASVRDGGGWSLKDHIAHIAAWEEMVVAFFEDRPRFAELGLDEAAHAADTDLINERIHEHRRHWPVSRVLERSHTAHGKLVDLVEGTAESDLMKTLSQFRPGGPSPGDTPVYALIIGNTFGHYDEHMPAMRQLIMGVIDRNGKAAIERRPL